MASIKLIPFVECCSNFLRQSGRASHCGADVCSAVVVLRCHKTFTLTVFLLKWCTNRSFEGVMRGSRQNLNLTFESKNKKIGMRS